MGRLSISRRIRNRPKADGLKYRDIGQFRHLGILQFFDPKTSAIFLLRPAGSAGSTNSSLCCGKLTASSNEAGFDPGEHQAFPVVTVEINRETFRQFFDSRQRSGGPLLSRTAARLVLFIP